MSDRHIDLEILRYNPETDQEPAFQAYRVPCKEDWVVLDAVNYIKDELDRTLSYRWSCHMAVCGSCGVMINGEPMLSCKAFLRDLPDRIRIEPLANFPIERDLVVVMDDFMDKLDSVKPYLVPREEKPIDDGEHIQTPAQLNKFKQLASTFRHRRN
jgi:fumarate reductase iron-sulfur subunit